jgi:uncharacterized protein YbjT (DUF2867 family)
MKVLVTGASGFDGHALVVGPTVLGHDVRAAVRHPKACGFPIGVETVPLADLAAADLYLRLANSDRHL